MSKAKSETKSDASGQKPSKPEDFYTRLAVHSYKRKALVTYLTIAFCLFLSLTFKNLLSGNSWVVILGPVIVIGLVMLLIPKSEEWEYKAWQSQPRQIERHQVERK